VVAAFFVSGRRLAGARYAGQAVSVGAFGLRGRRLRLAGFLAAAAASISLPVATASGNSAAKVASGAASTFSHFLAGRKFAGYRQIRGDTADRDRLRQGNVAEERGFPRLLDRLGRIERLSLARRLR
jgi:hypothetical protein